MATHSSYVNVNSVCPYTPTIPLIHAAGGWLPYYYQCRVLWQCSCTRVSRERLALFAGFCLSAFLPRGVQKEKQKPKESAGGQLWFDYRALRAVQAFSQF